MQTPMQNRLSAYQDAETDSSSATSEDDVPLVSDDSDSEQVCPKNLQMHVGVLMLIVMEITLVNN